MMNYQGTLHSAKRNMQYTYKKIKGIFGVTSIILFYLIIYINNRKQQTDINTKRQFLIESTSQKSKIRSTYRVYNRPSFDTKYILLWTSAQTYPFLYFGEGNTIFKNRKCKFSNCYVTNNRDFLGHYSEFEIIAFNGPELSEAMFTDDLPKIRSVHQKYVYANIEAATSYPICKDTWDGFFNWTWTYKLNSDALWGYFLIRNSSKHIIGPATNINWISEDNMSPINENIKSKLRHKSKAVAWFVSNCRTPSAREQYVSTLQQYMDTYNLKVEIYGECGDYQCPKQTMNRCLDELQYSYYFYLAFENAFSEDYITEKILHAFNHYTVPIVYSGVNYSRFIPPSSYLDAVELGPKELARTIYEIIQNPDSYYKFFRWQQYYSYHLRHETPETDDYCSFCAMMNDKGLMNTPTVYDNFSSWWTPAHRCAPLK